jgi:hypothetical protein
MDVTEALLEMHFHRAVVAVFAATYGAKFLRLLKPSSQQEAWVGFDQGWNNTSLTNEQLYSHLKASIASSSTSIPGFFLGYFMQFKAVRKMARRSKFTPLSSDRRTTVQSCPSSKTSLQISRSMKHLAD